MKQKIPRVHHCYTPFCDHDFSCARPRKTTQREFVSEDVCVDGRIIRRTVEKTIDMSEKLRGLSVNDFCLDNQIAVGSVQNFQPVVYPSQNPDAVIAGLDALASAPEPIVNPKLIENE